MASQELLDSTLAFINRYLGSLQKADWQTFESCLDDDFVYYTDQCTILQRQQFLDTMKASKWEGDDCRIHDLKVIASIDGSLIVAVYTADFKGTESGNALAFSATETTVMRVSGDWKIVHSHTSNGV